MNIFGKILFGDASRETRLGLPSRSGEEAAQRAQRMFLMTRGRGFRVHPDEPAVHPTFGTTRGQRKRAMRAAANAAERNRQAKEADRLIAQGSDPSIRQRFGSLA